MTKVLDDALATVRTLPPDEQDNIAHRRVAADRDG
jgi:hypothetical protein